LREFLRQRWFLLLLLTGLTLAGFCPEKIRLWTDYLPARATVALVLFLTGWSLESRSFLRSLARPGPALWAVVLSYGIVPSLAWSTGWLLPDADLRIGLLIIASVPCTVASALLWTRLAGGNEATTLTVVLLSTATSWLATSAWLCWGSGTQVKMDINGMMYNLLLFLVIPICLGQLSRSVQPLGRAGTRHKSLLGVLSRLLILAMVFKATVGACEGLKGSSLPLPIGSLLATAVLCISIHLVVLTTGLWSSRWLGFARPSQIAVAFACSQKTLPVSLYLYQAYYVQSFPPAVVSITLYHVGQLVVDTFIAEKLACTRTAYAECVSGQIAS
jgi:sodium/bile acid cotransporter 7